MLTLFFKVCDGGHPRVCRCLGEAHHRQERQGRYQPVRWNLLTPSPVNRSANMQTSANSTVETSPDRVDQGKLASIPKGENLPPAPIDGSVDKWFFISGAAV